MRMLTLVVIGFGCVAIMPLDGQGKVDAAPRPPWVFSRWNAAAISMPPSMAAGLDPYSQDDGSYLGVSTDLNRDGKADYILQGGPDGCGTGGCGYSIVNGATGKKIGDVAGNPIVVLAESTKGFQNLQSYFKSNCCSGTFSSYVFDGKTYKETSKFISGDALDELFARWNSYPSWPPDKQ